MMQRPKACEAFTLVESMVASVLLAFFVLGFLACYVNALRTQQTAVRQYRAECLARNRLQRARAFDFNSLHLLAENDVRIDENGHPSNAGAYRRNTSIVTNALPYAVRITVGVRYPIGSTTRFSEPVTMDTLISHRM